jgi:hypothetical protein
MKRKKLSIEEKWREQAKPLGVKLSSCLTAKNGSRAASGFAVTVSVVQSGAFVSGLITNHFSFAFSVGAWTWSDHFAFLFMIKREHPRAIRFA